MITIRCPRQHTRNLLSAKRSWSNTYRQDHISMNRQRKMKQVWSRIEWNTSSALMNSKSKLLFSTTVVPLWLRTIFVLRIALVVVPHLNLLDCHLRTCSLAVPWCCKTKLLVIMDPLLRVSSIRWQGWYRIYLMVVSWMKARGSNRSSASLKPTNST